MAKRRKKKSQITELSKADKASLSRILGTVRLIKSNKIALGLSSSGTSSSGGGGSPRPAPGGGSGPEPSVCGGMRQTLILFQQNLTKAQNAAGAGSPAWTAEFNRASKAVTDQINMMQRAGCTRFS